MPCRSSHVIRNHREWTRGFRHFCSLTHGVSHKCLQVSGYISETLQPRDCVGVQHYVCRTCACTVRKIA